MGVLSAKPETAGTIVYCRPMKRADVLLLRLFIANPFYGWNATGHKAISLIAYGQLLPVTRSRVDQLLAQHPDYSKWIAGVPTVGGRLSSKPRHGRTTSATIPDFTRYGRCTVIQKTIDEPVAWRLPLV